ncbi:MAG: msbA 2, partial [Clostridia bacterium]|nr:msbA 2 [Clostridia bacterium]
MKYYRNKYTFLNALVISFSISPLAMSFKCLLLIINGCIVPLQVLIVGSFLNNSINYISKSGNLNIIILQIALIVLLQVYNKFYDIILNIINEQIRVRHILKFQSFLYEKQAKLEYQYIEDPKTCDIIYRILNIDLFLEVTNNILLTIRLIIEIGGLFIIIAVQALWVSIIIILSIIPLLLISVYGGKKLYLVEKDVSLLTRKMHYYTNILTSRETAQERLLFGYTKNVNKMFQDTHRERTDTNLKAIISSMINNRISGIIPIFSGIVIMFALLTPVTTGDLSVGLYISIVGSVISVTGSFSTTVGGLVSRTTFLKQYLKDLSTFINMNEIDIDFNKHSNKIKFESIEFKNVSFRYPGTQQDILKNFNLFIESGKHYAIVGINGSGKTTIVKLITRLYIVTDGQILINGIDIRKYSYE